MLTGLQIVSIVFLWIFVKIFSFLRDSGDLVQRRDRIYKNSKNYSEVFFRNYRFK